MTKLCKLCSMYQYLEIIMENLQDKTTSIIIRFEVPTEYGSISSFIFHFKIHKKTTKITNNLGDYSYRINHLHNSYIRWINNPRMKLYK